MQLKADAMEAEAYLNEQSEEWKVKSEKWKVKSEKWKIALTRLLFLDGVGKIIYSTFTSSKQATNQ